MSFASLFPIRVYRLSEIFVKEATGRERCSTPPDNNLSFVHTSAIRAGTRASKPKAVLGGVTVTELTGHTASKWNAQQILYTQEASG